MRPYFDEGGVTLYHGDALACALPKRAAFFLIDPPYARAGGAHSGRTSTEGLAADSYGADQFWLHWFKDIARVLTANTAEDGCGFVFCDYRTIHLVERAIAATCTGWTVSQCVVWDREGCGLGSPFRASHELIAFCRGPKWKYDGPRNIPNVIRFPWAYGAHKHHAAEKPVGLLSRLIEGFCPCEGTILDIFAGSGTSLVAGLETGRPVIAWEADEDCCEIAANRVRKALAQGVLA